MTHEPRADAASIVSPRPDRVLVVDDDAAVRGVIAAALLRNGDEVLQASDGRHRAVRPDRRSDHQLLIKTQHPVRSAPPSSPWQP